MSKPRKQPPPKKPVEPKKKGSDLIFETQRCTALAKRVKRYIEVDGINPKEAVAVKEAVLEAAKILNEAVALISKSLSTKT
jgi:hypothetical protein